MVWQEEREQPNPDFTLSDRLRSHLEHYSLFQFSFNSSVSKRTFRGEYPFLSRLNHPFLFLFFIFLMIIIIAPNAIIILIFGVSLANFMLPGIFFFDIIFGFPIPTPVRPSSLA